MMKTVFLRVLEAGVDDKAAALKAAICGANEVVGRTRFEVDPAGFRAVPRSPFSYWVSAKLLRSFSSTAPFESGERVARQGGVTGEDFRFLRLSWEFPFQTNRGSWRSFAKGGVYSRYYCDISLRIWWDMGRNTFWGFTGLLHRPSLQPASFPYYFRPGLTWPLRTNGLSFRVMPAGCIFGHKGPAIVVEDDEPSVLLALNTILNSRAFGALVALQLARTELAQSYEVGLIQQTPVPDLRPKDQSALATLARRAWSLKRSLDTITENSHAFARPALLQTDGVDLPAQATTYDGRVADTLAELDRIQAEIDDRCFVLYGITGEDRRNIERGFGADAELPDEPEDAPPTDPWPLVGASLSWSIGVAFGRFDLRLASGDRPEPAEPDPFDPLPACSPGMLTGDDDLPIATAPDGYPIAFPKDGILVDDPGHTRDLTAAVSAVFNVVFEDGNARWHEAAELVGARSRDLRAWFARDFFTGHIKTYSKSRRKAPIYWQLGTPSSSYSVWIYYHRFSQDTLFRVLNDHVTPKLDHEESKLNALRQEAGPNPSSKQRKAIATQDTFVDELRAFKAELTRIAPLWNPDLNDGVIINFAPLWRLVPQHKPWQKECKKVWDALLAGDYDWAHLAMHLWPERVVPKCQDDRSLAIAHGLEDKFWYQDDDDGKWHKRPSDNGRVAALISARSSTAVKAALNELLSAPTPSGARSRKRRSRKRGGAT